MAVKFRCTALNPYFPFDLYLLLDTHSEGGYGMIADQIVMPLPSQMQILGIYIPSTPYQEINATA